MRVTLRILSNKILTLRISNGKVRNLMCSSLTGSMRASIAVLVIATWSCCSAAPQPLLVAALQKHFHTGCVHLLYFSRDMSVSRDLILQQVALAALGVPTATLSWDKLNDSLSGVQCRRNRPLYVITSWEEEAIAHLKQLWWTPRLSHPRWLLSLDVSTPADALSEVAVPFDCEFLVSHPGPGRTVLLTEVYRANGTLPLRAEPWGCWDPDRGLSGPERSLHQRRRDLDGATIRVVMVNDQYLKLWNQNLEDTNYIFYVSDWLKTDALLSDTPFEVVKKREDNSLYAEGLLPSLWYIMEKELNFTTEMQLMKLSRGSKVNSTTWGGIMGMITRDEADLSINYFTMTSSRRAAVDYSVPIVITKTCVLIQTPKYHEDRWPLYLDPFSVGVSVTFGVFVLLITAYMAGLYRIARYLESGDSDGYDLLTCLHCVWGMVCLQPHNTTPRSWSCRLVFWFSICMAYVMFYSFAAVFIAKMTVRRTSLPFVTLKGLLEDGTYTFGVTNNTGLFSNIHNATDDVMKRVYHELIVPNKKDLPSSYKEGLERVCEGKYAFMTVWDIAMSHREHIHCPMSVLPHAFFHTTLAMIRRRGQPYGHLLDHTLQRERQTGSMQRLFLNQWLRPLPTAGTSFPEVHLDDISPVLIVWMSALAVSAAILALEFASRRQLFTRCVKRLRRIIHLNRQHL